VLFIEDDDWYSNFYVEAMLGYLALGVHLVGEGQAKFYNVRHRYWTVKPNKTHASLATSAIGSFSLQDWVKDWLRKTPTPLRLDVELWNQCPEATKFLMPVATHCVQMKGVTGRPGVGVDHRPDELLNQG